MERNKAPRAASALLIVHCQLGGLCCFGACLVSGLIHGTQKKARDLTASNDQRPRITRAHMRRHNGKNIGVLATHMAVQLGRRGSEILPLLTATRKQSPPPLSKAASAIAPTPHLTTRSADGRPFVPSREFWPRGIHKQSEAALYLIESGLRLGVDTMEPSTHGMGRRGFR